MVSAYYRHRYSNSHTRVVACVYFPGRADATACTVVVGNTTHPAAISGCLTERRIRNTMPARTEWCRSYSFLPNPTIHTYHFCHYFLFFFNPTYFSIPTVTARKQLSVKEIPECVRNQLLSPECVAKKSSYFLRSPNASKFINYPLSPGVQCTTRWLSLL